VMPDETPFPGSALRTARCHHPLVAPAPAAA
jgi:hypothetical protein